MHECSLYYFSPTIQTLLSFPEIKSLQSNIRVASGTEYVAQHCPMYHLRRVVGLVFRCVLCVRCSRRQLSLLLIILFFSDYFMFSLHCDTTLDNEIIFAIYSGQPAASIHKIRLNVRKAILKKLR